jgi:signal transduction histidine kinase
MTGSYVLVTAAAVVLVEVVGIGVIIPSYLAGQDLTNRVVYTAGAEADRVGQASLSATGVSLPTDFNLGTTSSLGPGQVSNDGAGVVVPQIRGTFPVGSAPVTVALLISRDGKVLASSYPARYPVAAPIDNLVPLGEKSLADGFKGEISDISAGKVAWTVQPVMIQLSKSRGFVAPGEAKPNTPDAYLYVQAPVQAFVLPSLDKAGPLAGAGLIVLALALPVGVVFGLFTTRGLVSRLRRLAATTAAVAEGNFTQRLPGGSGDEVGRLERNFNEMAERLSEAVNRERLLAYNSAQQAERNRISRELHDSISQQLFSISLLAAGMTSALPTDSPLVERAHTLAETAEAANREMRALLLELRPATLDDKGLVPALNDLAATYSERLGVQIEATLEPLHMDPAAELAALRIAQEGLANAIRHSRATNIRLALRRNGVYAELSVADDGVGFEPGVNGSSKGLGLRLMRERVEEVGGALTITAGQGQGTLLAVSIPGVIT